MLTPQSEMPMRLNFQLAFAFCHKLSIQIHKMSSNAFAALKFHSTVSKMRRHVCTLPVIHNLFSLLPLCVPPKEVNSKNAATHQARKLLLSTAISSLFTQDFQMNFHIWKTQKIPTISHWSMERKCWETLFGTKWQHCNWCEKIPGPPPQEETKTPQNKISFWINVTCCCTQKIASANWLGKAQRPYQGIGYRHLCHFLVTTLHSHLSAVNRNNLKRPSSFSVVALENFRWQPRKTERSAQWLALLVFLLFLKIKLSSPSKLCSAGENTCKRNQSHPCLKGSISLLLCYKFKK